jgi:hypothetical protein
MNLLELFIRAEILVCKILSEQKNISVNGGENFTKVRKSAKKKIEFGKIWFMQNFSELRSTYADVFEDLEFADDPPESIFRECKAGHKLKDPRCMQFYDFINKIYTDEVTPKKIVHII